MNNKTYGNLLKVILALFLTLFTTIIVHAQSSSTIAFETDEGSWMSLDISPDGEHLVFELLGNLYRLPIAGGTAEPLMIGRDFISQPRFSPNGKQLVFVSDRSGEDNLWLADADGRNPRQLSQHLDGELISPTWSKDGQTILVSRLASRRSMTTGVELWAYPLDGSAPSKIDTPNMGRGSFLVSTFPPGAYGPQPSADGSHLFYTAAAPRQHGDPKGPSTTIMKVAIGGGNTEPVSPHDASTFKPQLSHNGIWLVLGAMQDNKTGLRLRNLETGTERWLIKETGFNALESWASRDMLPNYAFTPSDDALILAWGGKIRRVNLSNGQVTNIPFNANVEINVEPRVYTSAKMDAGPVTARIAKGSVLSPDGTQHAFSAFGRLYRIASSGDGAHRLTSQSEFGEFHPSWSPDGTWLTYVTWTATEGGAIWKVRADGGAPAQRLTSDEAFYRNPVWSPDGKSIWAVQAPKNIRQENARGPLAMAEQIVKLSSNGGKPTTVIPAMGAARVHFSGDSQRFYAYTPRLGLSSWMLDGSDQKTHLRVMGLPEPAGNPAMASDILLSPNGDHALAAVSNQLYLIDMAKVPKEQPSVNVYTPGNTWNKMTTMGADEFSWGNSETFAWSAGVSLYKKTIYTEDINEINANIQKPRHTPEGLLALRGARIITMDGDKIIEDGDILVKGNRIQAIGESGTITIPKAAAILDMEGKTIMPGIVDIHAHWQPKRSVLDLIDPNALANLAYGVTAIRDPQSLTDDIFVYSDAVETGEMIGPRIFSTGQGVFFFNNFQSYDQVYAVLERYKKKYRTHLIKSYLPGNRQVRQWVVRACRELGLIVTTEGAADAKMGITFALDGFSGNEHAVPIVPLYKDIVQLYAQSGISYTPTLLVSFGGPFAADHFIANQMGLKDDKLNRFLPSSMIQQRLANANQVDPEHHIFPQVAKGAKDILDAGGNVGLGGHGEMQGLQVHWEMWALSAGGMNNLDVLRVATLESAKAIGLDSEIGSIEIGKMADLLVLDKNPLEDIMHSNSVEQVMVNGVLYNASTLEQQWPMQKSLPALWWKNQ